MAVPTSLTNGQLQHMLQSAVQAVQWTYCLFWQFCPQQGILVWGEGYYNGAIKTRKTVQPSMEVSAEEVNLQRSQQIRELYDSMSIGEPATPNRRPSASLSPEDLTETEWFYLMCISFSFPPGDGLPGKAYAKGQHVWLTGANEVDSSFFSRAILAKSAQIQTVVCIPLMDGVVEFGNTERVQEDSSFIQQVKSHFVDHYHHSSHSIPPPIQPKPALSEQSTSNPTPSSARSHFHSPLAATSYVTQNPTLATTNAADEEEEEDDDNEEDEAEVGSDSEAQTNQDLLEVINPNQGFAQPSELMQLEMPEDIRLGSPEDASNNLDPDFCMVLPPNSQPERTDPFKAAESSRRWPVVQQQQQLHEPNFSGTNPLQPPLPSVASMDELSQEDRHYSQTVAIVLQLQTSPEPSCLAYSPNSAFTRWNSRSDDIQLHLPVEGASQWLLKYILFTVPYLHTKQRDDNNITSPNYTPNAPSYTALARLRQGKGAGTPQDELSANHVLAERRRREKLNERFIILRSLVPFVTKMDKASILGDTIEYVKQLRKKIQELEARVKQIDSDHKRLLETTKSGERDQRSSSTGLTTERGKEKRKVRVLEGDGGNTRVKAMEMGDMLQVSIIENDALVELQCPYKEGLLLDVMLKLRDMRLEVTSVQSSLNNGFIAAELRAKVKENANGKKASIVEVKKAVYQIVPHTVS